MRRLLLLALVACDGQRGSIPPVDAAVAAPDAGAALADAAAPDAEPADLGPTLTVIVTLDGQPAANTKVVQGGRYDFAALTGPDGRAEVPVDWSVPGEVATILASHPEARIGGDEIEPGRTAPLEIALTRYAPDNPAYLYSDPGEPGRRESTAACGHCHQTINDAWFASPHRSSASNPLVHDLYSGAAHRLDEAACRAAGGRWRSAPAPGTRQPSLQCFLGEGTLPALNASCAEAPCDQVSRVGACADCHAPGIDGPIGGRDLREATGFAFDYGVHCDVCHRTDRVVDEAPAGVAGRLVFTRPSEEASRALGAGGFLPLTFGPSADSPNPRMGSVERPHFRESRFCAGCHELLQGELTGPIDRGRWPEGRLPIHSTFSEWRASPMAGAADCQDCHMPPDPTVTNGGDLQLYPFAQIGFQGGFVRPAGQVRKHAWFGPRQPASNMLELAAAVFIATRVEADRVIAEITVRNSGCGHALPTGEPLRHLVLEVDASCGGAPLAPLGGHVVPDYGGAEDAKTADLTRWPGARIGDRIRVVRRSGAFREDRGPGPFGDGRFTGAAKGLPEELFVGEARVTNVQGELVTLSAALPNGDVAYRIRDPEQKAGAPGYGFARVLADSRGRRMVPHFAAVDVVSDNRIPAAQETTTEHHFAPCERPRIRARLIHRAYPFALAKERGWPMRDHLMTEVSR